MTAAREPLLTAPEVMALLGGVSKSFLTKHAADLGTVKIGRSVRFEPAVIDAYIERRRATAAPAPATKPAARAKPTLSIVGKGDLNPVDGKPWNWSPTPPAAASARRLGGE